MNVLHTQIAAYQTENMARWLAPLSIQEPLYYKLAGSFIGLVKDGIALKKR
jgi:hypothetical protein